MEDKVDVFLTNRIFEPKELKYVQPDILSVVSFYNCLSITNCVSFRVEDVIIFVGNTLKSYPSTTLFFFVWNS